MLIRFQTKDSINKKTLDLIFSRYSKYNDLDSAIARFGFDLLNNPDEFELSREEMERALKFCKKFLSSKDLLIILN
jgi:hypothetical protein